MAFGVLSTTEFISDYSYRQGHRQIDILIGETKPANIPGDRNVWFVILELVVQ